MNRKIAQSAPGERPATPQVSVLIVAYNSREQIARCIAAARAACQTTTAEYLLIDNGDDGTEALVGAQCPDVRVLPGRGNIGFGRGMNLLASEARAPFLVLLNPDMFLQPGAIDRLYEAVEGKPLAGAWGGLSLDENGAIDSGNAIDVPSLKAFAAAAMGRTLARRAWQTIGTADANVPVLSGCFVMVRREAWDAVSGFDEGFFLYCEEVDLFTRMRCQGFQLWRIGKACGTHQSGHGDPLSPQRMLLRAAGIMHFTRKHWSPFAVWLGAALFWIAAVERFLVAGLVGARNPRLQRIGTAYRSVVISPMLWFHGYDAERGLLSRLKTSASG